MKKRGAAGVRCPSRQVTRWYLSRHLEQARKRAGAKPGGKALQTRGRAGAKARTLEQANLETFQISIL